jgi:hypothetical protein
MKVGPVTESVEVTSATPLLQTQSTEISTIVDANTNVNLPLAARNYIQLTLLAPGTTHPSPDNLRQGGLITGSGRPYINGNREQANGFLLEGIDNNETSNNEVGYTPSIDAIQEFNLITQNASAEFGNYAGGIVSATLKSGTNGFHGTVFEFIRNDKLNANSWSNNLAGAPKTKLRWNMFGGSIGGPVIKDKLFFFADYQGQRFDYPSTTQSTSVFTDLERAGDFGALCTEAGGTFNGSGICTGGTGAIQLTNPNNGNPIPNNNLATAGLSISPVTQALFASSAYPHAAIQSGAGIANGTKPNYFSQSNNQLNNDQGDLRIDYNISEKDRLNGHYSRLSYRNPYNYSYALIGGPGLPVTEPAKNAGVAWTHLLTSNLLNEARAGFNAVVFNQDGTNASTSLGDFGESLGISGANAFAKGMPNVSFTGNASGFSIGSGALEQNFHTTAIQAQDSLLITHGRHSIKTGFQYWRWRLDNAYSGNGGLLGSFTISNLTGFEGADFWLGLVQNGSRGSPATFFQRRGNTIGAFVQDDWKITSTVTLNLGLRFEDHTPFYEVNNKQVNFGLYSGAIQVAGQNGNGKALYDNYWGRGDYQPRIGISWAPERFHGKTVLRAGYALSTYTEGGGVNQQLTANPPFSGAASFIGAGNIANGFGPVTPPCATIDNSCYIGKSIHMWDPKWQPMVSQQVNLTVQHQLSNSTTFQIGYVGQRSTHLLNLMDYTQYELVTPAQYDTSGNQTAPAVYDPGPYLAGNTALKASFTPASGQYAFGTASNGRQAYDAMQAVLQKRMSGGLQAQVAYTYAKCLSNSGGYYGSWGSTQTSHAQVGWQNIYDARGDWGPCFYDVTHTLTSYAIYQIPVGHGRKVGNNMNAIADAVVGGWEVAPIVTIHSGFGMTVQNAWWDPSGTGGLGGYFGNERPNCLGPVKYLKRADPVSGIDWFDPSSFQGPQVGTFGNCGVGVVRGPGYFNADLGIHKDFRITEGKRLEFRTEFLNAFNHRILTAPALNCSDYAGGQICSPSSGLGRITGSMGERNIQFALKFYY